MKNIYKYLALLILISISISILLSIKVTSSEKFTNLKFSTFDASHNSPNNLGNIFKTGALNLKEYPNVEIKPGQQLFQTNKFLPECCFYYSDYSTDKGCPCITPEQQYYLQRRGLNKDKQSFKKNNNYQNVFFSPTNALKVIKMIYLVNMIYIQKSKKYH